MRIHLRYLGVIILFQPRISTHDVKGILQNKYRNDPTTVEKKKSVEPNHENKTNKTLMNLDIGAIGGYRKCVQVCDREEPSYLY